MFLGGAYVAVNYPPLAQHLGSKGNTFTVIKTIPTTLTHQTTITTTHLSTYTYTTISTEFATTTFSQIVSTIIEVTKTTTTTITVGSPAQTTIISAELVNPSKIYFTDWYVRPGGKIYMYDYQSHKLGTLVDKTAFRVGCFAFHPTTTEKIYYVDFTQTQIRSIDLNTGREELIFNHTTYIKCVRFGPDGELYFSEYREGADIAKIYKIVVNEAKPFYELNLEEYNWMGDFDFDKEGRIYLSSGNVYPGEIYVVDDVNQAPRLIASFREFPIVGVRYVESVVLKAGGRQVSINKGLLLTDFKFTIYLYDLDSEAIYKIYENSNFTWLYDVSLRK